MDKLSRISLENTVTVKIDYNLNQQLLVNNFVIIMDCLKQLKTQQDKNTHDLSGLASLKDTVDKMREEIRIIQQSQKDSKHHSDRNSDSNAIDKAAMKSLQKQIDALKQRMTKNQGFTNDNIKDINVLLKDMKDVKEEIQNLKKQLQNINSAKDSNQLGDKNLSKNQNLNQETINNLNQQAQKNEKLLQSLMNQMQDMKNHIAKLQGDLNSLKNIQQQMLDDKKLEESISNNNTEGVNLGDPKILSDLMKKIEFLTKKAENMQSQLTNNSMCINDLKQTTYKHGNSIGQLKDNVDQIHSDIEKINKLLDQLSRGINGGSKNGNNDLSGEIQKLKQKYEKLLKMINSMKAIKSTTQLPDGNQTDRLSNKNMGKFSQERSFRKRSDSVDINGKIRDLTERIKYLQKLIGEDNPQKLPSIGSRKPYQTGYNGQKSNKKQMSEIKNDLQIWVKSYLDNLSKNNGGNLIDLELKVQQIRNNLAKKADHEGMKKGLAFLQGKITQLFMFLTQPESEDAMIVRKGFNCLSCSKKVESLRGKLGPRMNWDNLNSTHHNIHTPPKGGYTKYGDSNQRQSV